MKVFDFMVSGLLFLSKFVNNLIPLKMKFRVRFKGIKCSELAYNAAKHDFNSFIIISKW
jgi:hypothetical protein